MLSRPLPKTVRVTVFALGLTMLTIAGAFEHLQRSAPPAAEGQASSHCPTPGPETGVLAAPRR